MDGGRVGTLSRVIVRDLNSISHNLQSESGAVKTTCCIWIIVDFVLSFHLNRKYLHDGDDEVDQRHWILLAQVDAQIKLNQLKKRVFMLQILKFKYIQNIFD